MSNEDPNKNLEAEKQQSDLEKSVKAMFLKIRDGELAQEEVQKEFELIVNTKEFSKLINAEDIDCMIEEMKEILKITKEQEFIKRMISVLQPVNKIKRENPIIYEDAKARISMESGNFKRLNSRVSYDVGDGIAHFHLSPSFHVKDKLREIFIDGMNKLAKIVEEQPEIESITGTSWIVATKTYGEELRAAGFKIEEVPDWVKEKYFQGEEREIKKAVMDRDNFLKIFSKK